MGHSQADKAQSRERILMKAAEKIRDTGLESVSVGPLMRSVNLTHGGFYGHFASRSELLAHALERALREGEAASKAARREAAAKAAKAETAAKTEAAAKAETAAKTGTAANAGSESARPGGYATLLRSYLSRTHRDSRKSGCAIAALASDVARADEASREVMTAHVERFVENVARTMGTDDDERALLAASAMVGGLLLSRIVTDPKRSDQILRAVRDGLAARQDDGAPAP
jgi:TetR/AcrR family transcriptional repressor of nem operon